MILNNLKSQIKATLKDKLYKLPYKINFLTFKVQQLFQINQFAEYDLVFIVNKVNKGWILDVICQEIAKNFSEKFLIYYWDDQGGELPTSKIYFFSHYLLFIYCLRSNPILFNRKLLIFYTHPSEGMNKDECIYTMNQATQIISMCSHYKNKLIDWGIQPEKVTFMIGGAADPQIFLPHHREQGIIGFCSAYYPRKNPQLIVDIIEAMPHKKFILLGKGWEEYKDFSQLLEKPNFNYYNIPYEQYPLYYNQIDIFVSPSKLEGGPIPLIEAMMSNIVPVASNTGFASDIIQHGYNGFLFDTNADLQTVIKLIEQAANIKTNIRETVLHLTWDKLSLEMNQIIKQYSQAHSTK